MAPDLFLLFFTADGKMRRFFERSDELNPDEYQPGMIPNLWESMSLLVTVLFQMKLYTQIVKHL